MQTPGAQSGSVTPPGINLDLLEIQEGIHRQRVGHNFAYTRIGPHQGRYALAIAEASVSEHFPVTRLIFNSVHDVLRVAEEFNHSRLHLTRLEAATIIATSLGILRFRWRPFLFDGDGDWENRRGRRAPVGVWLEERPN